MKIENLKEGQAIKNYKELCLVLEMDEKKANSKKSQMKEFKRFVEYETEGHKFKIIKIKETPDEKEDLRKEGKASPYSEDMQKLILDLLSRSEEKLVSLSINMLLKELQMVNSNYAAGRRNTLELSKILKIDERVIEDFYGYTHRKLKSLINNALDKLSDKKLIYWEITTWVAIEKVEIELNMLGEPKLNKKKEIQYTLDTEYREATNEEKHAILLIEKEVLNKYECESISEIFYRGLSKTYFKEVNKLLQERLNIKFSYQCYNLIQNSKEVKAELLGRYEKVETYNKLNKTIVEESKKSIDIKHNNSKLKVDWHNYSNWTEDTHRIRADENYSEQAKMLSDKILDRKTRNFSSKLKKVE